MKAVFKCDFCDETFDNEIEAVEHEKKCSRNPENKITDCTITRLSMILHKLNEIIGAVISDLRDDQIDLLKQILKDVLDLINRQKAEIEELKLICDKERADRLYLSQQNKAIIAGQETLQKALAKKDREVERLTAEKGQLIKAFDECQAEAVKVFAKRLKKECLIDRGYEILHEGTIDNLVREKIRE